jgi:hypothetical protein
VPQVLHALFNSISCGVFVQGNICCHLDY